MATTGEVVKKEALVSAMRAICDSLETLLSQAKDAAKESTEQFIGKDIANMFGLAITYKNAFEKLGILTKKDFERKVQQHFRDADVAEAYEEWNGLEAEWDAFLKGVDSSVSRSGPLPLTQGQTMQLDQALVDAGTGDTTCLKDLLGVTEEFLALGARLVLVSFGVREGAVLWLRDMQCPFPMVLDAKRQLYQLFGLERSVFKVWSVGCLVYYAEQMLAGTPLPSPYKNIHDDVNQLGGDFIVTAEGTLTFFYGSKTASDRPAVQRLLDALH